VADPFPAIAEASATGETADLFADIRATVGVRVVNLVWRHLATIDGALPWAWAAWRRATRTRGVFSLLFVDIDRFKAYNDTYGHQVGAAVLRWLGLLMPQLVRQSDWVARYGGEELAIILPGASMDVAYELAERIRLVLAEQLFERRGVARSLMHDLEETGAVGAVAARIGFRDPRCAFFALLNRSVFDHRPGSKRRAPRWSTSATRPEAMIPAA